MSTKDVAQASRTAHSSSKEIESVKSPPPEDPQTIRTKSWVMFSFWAVAVFLGLPIWLWTTSIHRASLPTQEMLDWADGRACQLDVPLWFDVQASQLSNQEARGILGSIDKVLKPTNSFKTLNVQWNLTKTTEQLHQTREDDVALHIRFTDNSDLSTPSAQLLPHSTILEVLYDHKSLKKDYDTQAPILATIIAQKIQDIFAEEQLSVEQLLAANPSYNKQGKSVDSQIDAISADLASKVARKRIRSVKYAPTYHVSISLFTPAAVPTSWDVEAAVSEYLKPLLRSFSISNFTVDTQLQLYAPFSPAMQPPQFDWAKAQWILREEDLSSFVNAAEWPLSPNIGEGPTLNFILYIPEESLRPLVVKDSGATSWIVPQWGGISIWNPTEPVPSHLAKEHIQSAMLTFSHQLLSLLGAPDTPSSFPLQLQTLTRLHTLTLMLSASSTLGSLARLSESLSTIPIPEEVLLRVQRSLGHLSDTCTHLKAGRTRIGLENARLAEAEAEKAFFEKDMVSQVYFPDEHKVAVYLPLLGPIGVPLLTSVIREVKRRRMAGTL